MSELWDRILLGAGELADILPGLIGALVILLTGYLVAKQLERWTDKTLHRLEFKRMVAAGGFAEAVNRGRMDPVNAVGRLVFWLMMLVVILFASSALGLESIRDMFARMIAFVPNLISGIIIIILGIIIGEFVQGIILASAGGVSGVPTLAKLTKGIMVLISLFMALQQVGVAEEIVTSAFTLILGSVALAAGLAFGFGNRELAGEITRKWYEAGVRRNRRKTDPPEGVPTD